MRSSQNPFSERSGRLLITIMKKPSYIRPSLQRLQAGAALIEILVSVLLFSLGVLGLLGLQARAIGFSVDAEDRNRAALLANEVASEMWMNRSSTIPAAKLTAWQARVANPAAGGLPNGDGTVTAVNANTADVRIAWRAPSRLNAESDSQLTTRITVNLP